MSNSIASHPINLGQFQTTARSIRDSGGTMDINANRQLVIRGKNWQSRASLWLKDHFVPGHKRARSQRVLNEFSRSLQAYKSLNSAFPDTAPFTRIDAAPDSRKNGRALAETMLKDIDRVHSEYHTMPNLTNQIEAYLHDCLPKTGTLQFSPEMQAIMGETGHSARDISHNRKEIGNHFTDLVMCLGRGEKLIPGHEGVIGFHRKSSGTLSHALMRESMKTAMHHTLNRRGINGSAVRRAMPGPKLSPGEKTWLQQQYRHYIDSGYIKPE